MPVSFPAPFLEMKDVPHPQGVSELEAQNQSQSGSLEGVGESSLPCPPNHKDALLA